jgi:hypothetical protein
MPNSLKKKVIVCSKRKNTLEKYLEAVGKSTIGSNRESYNLCFNRAQDEQDALDLKVKDELKGVEEEEEDEVHIRNIGARVVEI